MSDSDILNLRKSDVENMIHDEETIISDLEIKGDKHSLKLEVGSDSFETRLRILTSIDEKIGLRKERIIVLKTLIGVL